MEISKQDGVQRLDVKLTSIAEYLLFYIKIKKVVYRFKIEKIKNGMMCHYNKNALVVNTGLALQFLSKGKFKATNHRVLWNKKKRMSVPFFFEPSYDFKMSRSFLNRSSKIKDNGFIYEKFLNKSLKKFVEYQR